MSNMLLFRFVVAILTFHERVFTPIFWMQILVIRCQIIQGLSQLQQHLTPFMWQAQRLDQKGLQLYLKICSNCRIKIYYVNFFLRLSSKFCREYSLIMRLKFPLLFRQIDNGHLYVKFHNFLITSENDDIFGINFGYINI